MHPQKKVQIKKSPHENYKTNEIIHHGQESADIDSRFRILKNLR